MHHILRNYFAQDSPQMANIVQRILANPDLIKQIYAKLKGYSKEQDEEEEYGDDGDSLWDILEYIY